MPSRINLLPKEERIRTTTNYAALGLLVGAVMIFAAIALVWYWWTGTRSNLEAEVNDLVQQRTELEAEVASLRHYEVLDQRVGAMQETVRYVYAGRTLLSEVLYDLSRAIQSNVWLVSLTMSAPEPSLGVVTDDAGLEVAQTGSFAIQGNTYSFPDVAAFMVRLELVEALRNIRLSTTGDPLGGVANPEEVRGFSMSASVVNTQDANTQLPISKIEVEGQ